MSYAQIEIGDIEECRHLSKQQIYNSHEYAEDLLDHHNRNSLASIHSNIDHEELNERETSADLEQRQNA